MNINRFTHSRFRMTNMEDEDNHKYTLLIQDDKHGRRRLTQIKTTY